jgi:L-lactate dehydrogenase complex protein LldG
MPPTENAAVNPGREQILARIRTALETTAPQHKTTARQIFAPIPDALERYKQECSTNNTELITVPDLRAAGDAVGQVLGSLPSGEIFVQEAPVLRHIHSGLEQTRATHWSSEGTPPENAAASITRAEALIASTGSVLFSAACGGRAAALTPPVHIVVAGIEQLVPDLAAGFARARERGALATNSYLSVITGSSRTSDIEKILVMGAHGPRRLAVVLVLRAGEIDNAAAAEKR